MGVDGPIVPQRLRGAWNDLARRAQAPPWGRPGWFEAWWSAFGRGTPCYLTLWDGPRLRAVAPFIRTGRELLSASNEQSPSYAPLVESDEAGLELMELLMGGGRRRVTLRLIPQERWIERSLENARSRGLRPLRRLVARSPWIDTREDWERFVAGRSSKLRAELRRRQRRLGEQGTVELSVEGPSSHLVVLMHECFLIEASGWKGARGTAIAKNQTLVGFYRAMADWAASEGLLRIGTLRVSGRLIAFDLSLEDERGHYLLKTGFDPEFSRWAPALLLRYGMIKRAFEEGLERYEFLGHDEPWKLEWTDKVHERYLVRWFAPTAMGRADEMQFKYLRPFARSLADRFGDRGGPARVRLRTSLRSAG